MVGVMRANTRWFNLVGAIGFMIVFDKVKREVESGT